MLTSTLETDRLPTISASQALETFKAQRPHAISTGLPQLDDLLQGQHGQWQESDQMVGGLARGRVTEVHGPPGVGKTTLAMQACAAVLRNNDHVVWVDASYNLARPRLYSIIDHVSLPHQSDPGTANSPPHSSTAVAHSKLHHFNTPTLAHLLALVVRAPPSFPPPSTSLLVIDSLSTLFDTAYAGQSSKSDTVNTDKKAKDARLWAANRRFAVVESLVSALNKLAAMRNIAVLVTSQMMTRVLPSGAGTRAILMPALSSKEWDTGVASKVVLFRDWPTDELRRSSQEKGVDEKLRAKLDQVRFAGVVKANGIPLGESSSQGITLGNVVSFTVDGTGIVPCSSTETPLRPLSSPIKISSSASRKRNFKEIADSDAETDDEYGWIEEDEIAAEGLIDDVALTTSGGKKVEVLRGDETASKK
ncbi:MAG: hypothetical protein M1821_008086 [Bathelium mastoideum]|nr:MAG: hypothetical protein M1821_008086 [Bathelium mastoideum]